MRKASDVFAGLFIIGLFLLPISQYGAVSYNLIVPRIVSIPDIILIFGGLGYVALSIRDKGISDIIHSHRLVWVPVAALTALTVHNLVFSRVSGIYSSASAFALSGGLVIFLFSFFAVGSVKKTSVIRLLYLYVTIMIAGYFILLVFRELVVLKVIMWEMPYYGAISFPFSNPNQAALFGTLIMLLGVGAVLAARKFYLLYLAVPVMLLAIAQTGSRSVATLAILAMPGFVLAYILNRAQHLDGRPPLVHLVLSYGLGLLLLVLAAAHAPYGAGRAVSLFPLLLTSPLGLITGTVDSYRGETWRGASEAIMAGTPFNPAVVHNAYLEFALYAGWISLLLFVIFLASLLVLATTSVVKSRALVQWPLFMGILLGLLVTLGAIYVNPLMHLRYVWVFFGLATATCILVQKDQKS